MRYFVCSFVFLYIFTNDNGRRSQKEEKKEGKKECRDKKTNTKNMLSKQLNHDHYNLFYFLCLFVAFL